MQKILMVCLGNICRSPVAEGIMNKIGSERGLKILVDSAGTSNYHIGESPDNRSVSNAKKNGIDISKLKARQFIQNDFLEFDHILVMDESNYKNVIQICPNPEFEKKVDLLLNKLYPQKNMGVPDPYYGGENGFENVYQLIYKACEAFADEMENKI